MFVALERRLFDSFLVDYRSCVVCSSNSEGGMGCQKRYAYNSVDEIVHEQESPTYFEEQESSKKRITKRAMKRLCKQTIVEMRTPKEENLSMLHHKVDVEFRFQRGTLNLSLQSITVRSMDGQFESARAHYCLALLRPVPL